MRNGPSGLLVGHRLPQRIEKPLEESSRSSPNLIAIPPKGAINLVNGLSEVEWLRTGRYRTGVFHSSGTDEPGTWIISTQLGISPVALGLEG